MELNDRVVLITGASMGIGAATARAFAEHPVRLALLARSEQRLQTLAAELNARPGVTALPLAADVSDRESVARAVGRTQEAWGAIDILVNNAGVGMSSPIGEIDLILARQLFDINYWGAIHVTEAVLPDMRARRDGLIINISSIIGRRAMPGSGVYCSSKFALNALSESMRVELRPHNIRVVSFYPGVTESEFSRNLLTGDSSVHGQGRMRPTPAAKVGQAIVRAASREPRDAYATLFDRFFVFSAAVAPWLMDWMLAKFYGKRTREN